MFVSSETLRDGFLEHLRHVRRASPHTVHAYAEDLRQFCAWLEEKKLVLTFGEAYKNYQQKVPMIIPRLQWHNRKKFAED